MKYVVNLTGNRNSMDGFILGKVEDFKVEMNQHEKEELNNYKKHPHMSACDRKSIVHNRFNNRDVELIMFGTNSYLGATIFPEAIEKAIEVTKKFGIGSGGVPLLTGTSIYQNELENIISIWIYSKFRSHIRTNAPKSFDHTRQINACKFIRCNCLIWCQDGTLSPRGHEGIRKTIGS